MIGSYNGWTKEERMATLPRLRAAIRSGFIPPPTVCSICRFRNADDPSGKNWVQHHDEDYDRIEPYEICRKCHAILHRRFERPQRWRRLVAAHVTLGCWFENLSLDPESRTRPYSETYLDRAHGR